MFEQMGKLLGIEIKPVQDVPDWIRESDAELRAITTLPTIPQEIWDVAGGGLNDQQLVWTNDRITGTAKLMRARLRHIRDAFQQLDLPLTYATYTIGSWLKVPKRAAEQALLYRFQRSQSGGRNWETPNNPLPIDPATGRRIDFDYKREVALARNHIHSGTMWAALKAQAPPPPGNAVYGYILPLTPQERAVSEEMIQTNWVVQRLPLAQRQTALRGDLPYALYPHLASAAKPGISVTYTNVVLYVKEKIQKIRQGGTTMRGTPAAIQAARAVMDQWQGFLRSIETKWGAAVLVPKDRTAVQTMGASPIEQWWATHNAQKDAWIAAHPEVRGELAHAKRFIEPHRRWLNWYSGQPFTKTGSDGTRLDYLIAVEVGLPLKAQQACQAARARAAQKAIQTGRTPTTFASPC